MKQAIIQVRCLIVFLLCNAVYAQTSSSSLFIENTFLWSECSSTLPGSTMYPQHYERTLASLSNLATEGALSGSFTSGTGAEAAAGYYYCRGNVLVTDEQCAACVRKAADDMALSSSCNVGNSATFWYSQCTLQVANFDIIGRLQVEPVHIRQLSPDTVTPDPSAVQSTIRALTAQTIAEAKVNQALGAATNAFLPDGQDVKYHVIVQCNPDISIDDCTSCISQALDDFQEKECINCGSFSSAILVLLPSCQYIFGYE